MPETKPSEIPELVTPVMKESRPKVKKTIHDQIIDLLKIDPTRAWGVTEIANDLKKEEKNRSTVHYHLQKLVKQGLAKKGTDGRYTWDISAMEDEQLIPLLEEINARKGWISENFLDIIRVATLQDPLDPRFTISALSAKDIIIGGPGTDMYHLGPTGAQKLGVCVVCGEKIDEGRVILAHDIMIHVTEERFIVHPRCLPILRGLIKDNPFRCTECGLPLNMLNLITLLCPTPLALYHNILDVHLTRRERAAYEKLRESDKYWEEGSEFESDWENKYELRKRAHYIFNRSRLSDIEEFLIYLYNEDIELNPNETHLYDEETISKRARELHSIILNQIHVELEIPRRRLVQYYFGTEGLFFYQTLRPSFFWPNDAEGIDSPCEIIESKKFHPECARRRKEVGNS